MAYFSNGTEGMLYREQYCDRCVHNDGCPVWSAHLLYAYEECNSESNAKKILDSLIPMETVKFDDGITYTVATTCSMFRSIEKPISEEEIMPAMRSWAKQHNLI